MAEADWDTVYLRKSKPKSSQLKSQQAVNAAQRQGIQVDTQKKSDEQDHVESVNTVSNGHQGKRLNVPQWKRKLRALHVGNLPTETTSKELETCFAEFGTILDAWVDDTRDKRAGFTFGFVRYDNLEAAEAAIEKMDNYDLNGRRVRVSFCHMTQNRLDSLDKMSEEELSKKARLVTEMKDEMEVQCRYYNDVYLSQLREQGEADGLEPVDTRDVLKGIALYEFHKAEQYNHVTGRVKLNLPEFDRLLLKEMPNRPKFVPPKETVENGGRHASMEGVRKTEEGQRSEVFIPGRGRPLKKPNTGRGAFLQSLLISASQNRQHSSNKDTAKLDRETEELHHDRIPLDVGKVMQQRRQELKMTQKDLATKINEKPQVINDYEAGRAIPNQAIMSKLERNLGVKLRGKDIGKPLGGKK